jgi:hypothetical protein
MTLAGHRSSFVLIILSFSVRRCNLYQFDVGGLLMSVSSIRYWNVTVALQSRLGCLRYCSTSDLLPTYFSQFNPFVWCIVTRQSGACPDIRRASVLGQLFATIHQHQSSTSHLIYTNQNPVGVQNYGIDVASETTARCVL